jgi:hypothetical protein
VPEIATALRDPLLPVERLVAVRREGRRRRRTARLALALLACLLAHPLDCFK